MNPSSILLPTSALILCSCLAPTARLGYQLHASALSSASVPVAPAAEPAADDDFEEHALDDMTVSTPDGRVAICVWDEACEDGDAIRVSIDATSYDVKLTNAEFCRSFALGPGTHELGILALNGTGYEGEDCSYANANTGAISVSPVDGAGETQSWEHRGGTGSRSHLFVKVP